MVLCLAMGAFGTGAPAAEAVRVRIPAEEFFSEPAIANVRISPDGRHLAYLADLKGRIGIVLMNLETGTVEPLVRADENVEDFLWKGSEHVVYVADVGGNESAAVQSINIGTGKIRRLLESYGRNNEVRQSGQWGYVESWWIVNPRKIIVRGSRDDKDVKIGLYEVDIVTGKRSPVGGFTNKKGLLSRSSSALDFVFDSTGSVRVQVIRTQKDTTVEARLGENVNYSHLMSRPHDLFSGRFEHATILADDRTLLWVNYDRHDRGALEAWSLETGEFSEEVFVPSEGEITGLILANDKSSLLGVEFEGDKPGVHWFDADLAGVQADMDKIFAGAFASITDMSGDRKRLIIRVRSDVEPGISFILDRSLAKPRLMSLGSSRPTLDSKSLAPMEVVRFRARDGLELQGYLTRPPGATGPGPLILNPHGGPYGIRDYWGYNGEVQFLANRGYAVLQVNYRGSGGFGVNFLEAGRLEWGLKMQDDLSDAVAWVVAEGIADPERVAIYGASYGGYAALAGAVFTPGLYRCAINYLGPVDLTYLGNRDQGGDPTMIELYYSKWIHPDMGELRKRSPVNHVEKIQIPTLHAYGENDPRVEYRHWRKFKGELDRHKKPYEVFNQDDEGHGFDNAAARVRFYLKLEEFLGKHMAADQ